MIEKDRKISENLTRGTKGRRALCFCCVCVCAHVYVWSCLGL